MREPPSQRSRFLSAFYDVDATHSTSNEDVRSKQRLLQHVVRRQCRIPNLYKLLACHPRYLESHDRLKDRILWGEGPLVVSWRHYIAIMAASRHQCHHLAAMHMSHFSRLGGKAEWLKGVDQTPCKLQRLLRLNALLAHQVRKCIMLNLLCG